MVAFLQFTYAGAPTVYYGDEIGMVGADDPDDRRGFTWGEGNEELVTWYATMAAIRENYPALRTGDVEVFETNENVVSYVRRDENDILIVLANNSKTEQELTLDLAELGVSAAKLTDLISGTAYTVENDQITVKVPALSGAILTENVKEITVNSKALAPAYDENYRVAERVLAESITLNKKTVTVKTGENVQLLASVLPANVTDDTVIWSSSDEKVATVDANGKVTAVAAGTATILAKAAFSPANVTVSCTLTVTGTEKPADKPTEKPAEEPEEKPEEKPASGNSNTGNSQSVEVAGTVIFSGNASEENYKENGKSMRRLRSTNGTDLSICAEASVLPQGAQFYVERLGTGDANYKKAKEAVEKLSGVEKFLAYDVDLKNASGVEIHQMDGYVNVTMPIPAGLDAAANITVYRLEADGSLTKCATAVKDGYITFSTNHFSTFVFVQGGVNGAPKTSDENAMRLYLAILLLLAGVAVFGMTKKKNVLRR